MTDKANAKTATIHALRGMVDLLPSQARLYRHVEKTAARLFSMYGYSEVRTPCIEATELFARTAGDASDIVVSKQMYTFTDAGDRSNTLRPEGTAGVVRALIEHGTLKEMPLQKLYYMGPMFRYEKPQKGRQRQFHQAGVEFFGVDHPAAEAEVIGLCHQFLSQLGFSGAVTHINSIGCAECRRKYNEVLRAAIESNRDAWCDQCRERAITNPMRVFD
jgi:histidyl-tRNA synthetase